jgi:hypothetical protein
MRDKLFLLTTILAVCNTAFIIGQTLAINWPADESKKTANISGTIQIPSLPEQDDDTSTQGTSNQTPPPTVEYDENSVFGVVSEIQGNELIVEDITSSEERFITIQPTSNAIITDTISVMIEDIQKAPAYQLSEIPQGSTVNINCQTLSNDVCTTDLIRFTQVQPN